MKNFCRTILVISCIAGCALGVGGGKTSAACAALDTSRGVASSSVTIPVTGTYYVWSRLKAPDTNNNSYWLEIDNSYCGIVVGDGNAIPAGSWTWVNYMNGTKTSVTKLSLSGGAHSVRMIGRENNVQIDRLIFTSDSACVPTDTGDNCASVATQPSTGTGSTTTTTPVSGTSSVSSSPAGSSTKVVNGATVPAQVPDSTAPSVAATKNISSPNDAVKAVKQIVNDTLKDPTVPLQIVRYTTAGKVVAALIGCGVLGGVGYLLYAKGLLRRWMSHRPSDPTPPAPTSTIVVG